MWSETHGTTGVVVCAARVAAQAIDVADRTLRDVEAKAREAGLLQASRALHFSVSRSLLTSGWRSHK